LSPVDPAAYVASLVVDRRTPEDVGLLMRRVENSAAERLPLVRVRPDRLYLGATPPGTVDFLVQGDDPDRLRARQPSLAQRAKA
jgi:hypothetical protein